MKGAKRAPPRARISDPAEQPRNRIGGQVRPRRRPIRAIIGGECRRAMNISAVSALFDDEAVVRARLRGRSRLPDSRLRGLAVGAGVCLVERLQDLSLSFARPVDFASHSSLDAAPWVINGVDLSPTRIGIDSAPGDFPEGGADLVVSHLALHLVNDLGGMLRFLRGAMSPDGLLLASFPGPQTLSVLRRVLMEAEMRVTGGVSARVAPFPGMEDLGRLVLGAGFALPVLERDVMRGCWGRARDLMYELRDEGVTNSLVMRRRGFTRRGVFEEAEVLWGELGGEEEFEVIYVAAWSPGEGQQRAMLPGSARGSLAAALGSDISDESVR